MRCRISALIMAAMFLLVASNAFAFGESKFEKEVAKERLL